jgi:hypothetical protein
MSGECASSINKEEEDHHGRLRKRLGAGEQPALPLLGDG